MSSDFYTIPGPWPGRLAIAPRPRGGDWLDDEIESWKRAGVSVIVSLLDAAEQKDLDLTMEGAAAKAAGIQYRSFPIPDRGVPASLSNAAGIIGEIRASLDRGEEVLVHCRQGIGRASLIAIGVLMGAGMPFDDAMHIVGAVRGVPVPETEEQSNWLKTTLADSLLATRSR